MKDIMRQMEEDLGNLLRRLPETPAEIVILYPHCACGKCPVSLVTTREEMMEGMAYIMNNAWFIGNH